MKTKKKKNKIRLKECLNLNKCLLIEKLIQLAVAKKQPYISVKQNSSYALIVVRNRSTMQSMYAFTLAFSFYSLVDMSDEMCQEIYSIDEETYNKMIALINKNNDKAAEMCYQSIQKRMCK